LAPITAAGPYAALAAAVHEFWRLKMIHKGWKPGRAFADAPRTHDCLVPFAELDPDDQWTAVEQLESLEAGDRLADDLRYPRGADVPLRARDMAVGLPVESTGDTDPSGRPFRGRITAWTTYPRSGRLESLSVRWDDGQITSHAALAGEVRRAGPPAASART
jgi:hypothetical protein